MNNSASSSIIQLRSPDSQTAERRFIAQFPTKDLKNFNSTAESIPSTREHRARAKANAALKLIKMKAFLSPHFHCLLDFSPNQQKGHKNY